MNAFDDTQKIYVAPDGTRITGRPNQGSGTYQAHPATPQTGSTPSLRNAWGSGVYETTPSPAGPSTPSQINVGLLAWGVILAIFGTLMLLTPLFGAGALQTLVIITFAAAGIAFLGLAYFTSKNDPPKQAPLAD